MNPASAHTSVHKIFLGLAGQKTNWGVVVVVVVVVVMAVVTVAAVVVVAAWRVGVKSHHLNKNPSDKNCP